MDHNQGPHWHLDMITTKVLRKFQPKYGVNQVNGELKEFYGKVPAGIFATYIETTRRSFSDW